MTQDYWTGMYIGNNRYEVVDGVDRPRQQDLGNFDQVAQADHPRTHQRLSVDVAVDEASGNTRHKDY